MQTVPYDQPSSVACVCTSNPAAIARGAQYSYAELTNGQDKLIADLTHNRLYFLTAGGNVMTNRVELERRALS